MHWFPFYTSDFIGATMECSCAERAMYCWMLVVYYERREPFPKDKHRLARLMGAESFEEKNILQNVLRQFFVERDDGWYQPQAEEIISRQNTARQRLSDAGKRGNEIRWRSPGDRVAIAKENQNKEGSSSLDRGSVKSSKTGNVVLALSPDVLTAVASPPVITIPLNTGEEFPIDQTTLAELERLYPDVDGLQTLREIRGWNLSNPTKRKTRTGVMKHVNNWFSREQNK